MNNNIDTLQLSLDNDPSWQYQLGHCIKDLKSLCDFTALDIEKIAFSAGASHDFPMQIPYAYASRIKKGDYNDPLLLQVLPQPRELENIPGFTKDPLEEADANHLTGLIHKYQHRVLLTLSGACAINCRYCFRRHFPYAQNNVGSQQWADIIEYIKADSNIEEVIFSGGDPLATSDKRLDKFINELDQITHVQRLRIHTRLPVVIPKRISEQLCNTLRDSRLQTVVVIHANHANEFDEEVSAALAKLKQAAVTVLNQAVLLKGINDTPDSQKALHLASFKAGALPYYLFVLDQVQGAAHFNIEDSEAQQLMRELQCMLPGYLVPKLAREIPGKPHKTLLAI
ncbi:MAG: EF-P beta-lysylation protein EpmB [Oceanospirillaceae bacterium]|nr:EF-P beta-lysylation protein EpmB [Oceanospirillaceae bacterium]